MQRTTDMTTGNPVKLILTFAFPLILTNLGQQFYMIADAAIVGRGVGVKALASVGAADWIYWLILWTITGLTQGFSVFISKHFGEKNYRTMNKNIAMSAILCVVIGGILTIAGLLCAKPLLVVLKTPEDIFGGAQVYLLTMISGALVVTAYNMASSILRALGDGRSPLFAMAIAAALNIGLDLVFVFVFKFGIFGAALASVLAQLFSFIYCAARIVKIDCIDLTGDIWKPDFALLKKQLVFGLPLSFQYIVIALGGIILQSTINLQGSIFVAGFTAVNKLYGLLESSAISLGIAFSTFFAQNYGAGNYTRVRNGLKSGFVLSVGSSLIVTVAVLIFGERLLKLFLDTSVTEGPAAMEVAVKYLLVITIPLFILYLLHLYKNALQSLGIASWSVVSGFGEFFVRVFMGKVVVAMLGMETLYYIEPCAWIGGLVFVMVPYYVIRKKLLPQENKSSNEASQY